jgi:hypothetical protein
MSTEPDPARGVKAWDVNEAEANAPEAAEPAIG